MSPLYALRSESLTRTTAMPAAAEMKMTKAIRSMAIVFRVGFLMKYRINRKVKKRKIKLILEVKMVYLSHLKFITYSEFMQKLQYKKTIIHVIEIIDKYSCLKFVQIGQNHQKLKVFDYHQHNYQQPY